MKETVKRENVFKIYFITCSLLAIFQEKGGMCAIQGEESLLEHVADYVENEDNKKELLEEMAFLFGLKERSLTKVLKDYERYRKENE